MLKFLPSKALSRCDIRSVMDICVSISLSSSPLSSSSAAQEVVPPSANADVPDVSKFAREEAKLFVRASHNSCKCTSLLFNISI